MPQAKYQKEYSLGLTEEMYRYLQKVAEKNSVSMAHVLRYIVKNALDKNQKSKPQESIASKFQVGDPVQVKEGVMDVELETVCMGGWRGIIKKIRQEDGEIFYDIEWDQETIHSMPALYTTFCKENGYELQSADIPEEDLTII